MTITIEQLKQIQTELEQKYAELGAMIKSFEKQQEEAEFPKRGDIYYSIDGYGKIRQGRFIDGITNTHHIPLGNCFRTKEEAEFAVEQLEVIAEMKRCGGVWKMKQDRETSYSLLCNNEEIHIHESHTSNLLPIFWFPTEEAAQKAIDTIGKERLLKYWFCVEV